MRARKRFRINAQKKKKCSSSSSSSGVQLRVLPSSSCFFDEAVQIKLSGLPPGKHVELRAKHQDDKGVVFRAAATYQADARGGVDLSRQPSTGGSYTGVEPMGLFWSMLSESPHKKLLKRDASSPVLVHIEAHRDGQVLTQGTSERRFMADGAQRVPVRDGRLRGTLFIPPGEGPFSGIITLYTLSGIVFEPQAALLANTGFVVFALALYGYQNMPKTMDKIDLEYFEEGLTFLHKHPKVKKTGMGILSLSKGGDLALSMASFLPNIAAVICVNACNANTLFPLHYGNMVIPPLIVNMQNITTTPSGFAQVLNALPDVTAEETRDTIIPIERASCQFLFIVSEDDKNWKSSFFAAQACSRLEAHGKANYEMLSYAKAGHFVDVPYMPHYPSGVHSALGQVIEFGGEPKAHADAQVDAWRRVQEFFKKHLNRVDYVKASL